MLVREILVDKGSQIFSCTPNETLTEVIDQLVQHNVGSLLVRDGGKMVGIITERDILRAVAETRCSLNELRASPHEAWPRPGRLIRPPCARRDVRIIQAPATGPHTGRGARTVGLVEDRTRSASCSQSKILRLHFFHERNGDPAGPALGCGSLELDLCHGPHRRRHVQ